MSEKRNFKPLGENAKTGGTYDGDAMCCCPVCEQPYYVAEPNCEHFLGDWCFTSPYERGDPKGQWATSDGNDLLADVCAAMETLQELLDNDEVQPEEYREAVIEALPAHLRHSLDNFSGILADRVAAAPGYIGSTELTTDSMASDSWDVHWARDAVAAARHIEKEFHADLSFLRRALTVARSAEAPPNK